jgi:PTH1 family peptidyl-tRNA hydrolase
VDYNKIFMTSLIVGLGNPGTKYLKTRHNVGTMFVEEFRKKHVEGVVAVKTGKPMNASGDYVKKLINKGTLKRIKLYVVHDDLDIPLGKFKIQKGKGPKDHNGLLSIYNALGTKDFWHVRIGVDNRDREDKTPGEKYVLENFTSEELVIIKNVIRQVVSRLST